MHSAYLLITNPHGEKRVELNRGYMWKVGRHEENDVVIPSDIVSRQHAMFQVAEDGTYYLIDMGSRNGSFVNGMRVSVPAALNDGDTISLGDTTIEFRRDATRSIRPVSRKLTGETTVAHFASNRTTVLVTDVRGFTVLTQQIDQGLLCQVIGTWFREAGPLLTARGSWAQKYIGDAIMSIWVHKKGENTQEMAQILRALVELVRMTATLQARFGLQIPIRIGAGINTGLAQIGNAAGSGSLTDYTALGDTVNAAFRLESATKDVDTDVLLGNESFEWLEKIAKPRDYFRARTVHLKGYDQPVTAWGAKFAALETFVEGIA
jgi:adenylate cyclase